MTEHRRSKEEVEILPGGDWMSAKWRPAMGWMYMAVCIFDFIVFPIFWTLIQAYDAQGVVTTEWEPLTLKGSGLFHVAMGAVLGVAAWSRGQEKITAMNNGFEPSIPPRIAPNPHAYTGYQHDFDGQYSNPNIPRPAPRPPVYPPSNSTL